MRGSPLTIITAFDWYVNYDNVTHIRVDTLANGSQLVAVEIASGSDVPLTGLLDAQNLVFAITSLQEVIKQGLPILDYSDL